MVCLNQIVSSDSWITLRTLFFVTFLESVAVVDLEEDYYISRF